MFQSQAFILCILSGSDSKKDINQQSFPDIGCRLAGGGFVSLYQAKLNYTIIYVFNMKQKKASFFKGIFNYKLKKGKICLNLK